VERKVMDDIFEHDRMFWFCLGATATKIKSSDWKEHIEEIIQQYYGNLLETLE